MFKSFLYFICFLGFSAAYAEIQSSSSNCEGVKEAFIEAGDAKLFCRTVGKGKPLIVIHGGPDLTQDYLLPGMYQLADNNFVIFCDQRGCGRSTGEINPKIITVKTLADDIEAIRKAYNFDKVSVLGHSWGGFIAMHYAIAYPKSIDKLVLSNSMGASAEDFTLLVQNYMCRMAPFEKQLKELRESKSFHEGDPDTVERYFQILFRPYCYKPEKVDLLNLRMTQAAALNGAKFKACIDLNVFSTQFDLHADLRKLNTPTLIVHGEADILPAVMEENLHHSIPNSKYVLMKNCGHFPYVEDPDAYFQCLKAFLD